MIYWIARWLMEISPDLSFLRVFRYITVRAAVALCVGFVLVLIIAPKIIQLLQQLRLGDLVRKIHKANCPDLYEMHKTKEGTPSMGGIIILGALLVTTLLFCRLDNFLVWLVIGVTLCFGLLGFWDDYVKIVQKRRLGLPAKVKFLSHLLLGISIGLILYFADNGIYYAHKGIRGNTHLCFPFFKDLYPDLGIWFIPFVALVLTATANAVNLTDGLDGLAIGVSIIVALCFGIIAYLVGRVDFARYLILPYVPGAGELSILLAATVGVGFGFLWFNSHPAQVFMGDTGSQALGAIIGITALLIKQELLLIIIGGIFVLEAISVILQIISYQTTGKRLFL
ncbi:MAG: phospho-N-acetylmuramoyl-pentapeptide-transferase, partial [Candidatus Sumerlaeia bacterium]|nr:phospho-N-acetylmuramoyl-pentapeptide-transferase [Candidatus Sumerlaeia bacterium]